MKMLSRNVELRYVSHDPKANGETDFKGETSTLSTQQRVDYLDRYAKVLPQYVDNFSLDQPIITIEEAKEQLKQIKPQPQPAIRRRIVLDDWRWIGDASEKQKQNLPKDADGIAIIRQDWRCFVEWELRENTRNSVFALGDACVAGIDASGYIYVVIDGQKKNLGAQHIHTLRIEADFITKQWNLIVDNEMVVDFEAFSDPRSESATWVSTPACAKSVWGIGYHPGVDPYEPILMEMLLDADDEEPIDLRSWEKPGYDDSKWQSGVLPIVHGGLRHAGEDLCLRKTVTVDEIPAIAELYVESLTPGGEIYVNGHLAAHITNPSQRKIDIAPYLHVGENLLAVKVYADMVSEQDKMTHTHTDRYTGWSCGRMHLDLLPEIHIDDVFTWTDRISENTASQKIRTVVTAQQGMPSAKAVPHTLRAKLSPWFPEDGAICAEMEWQTPVLPNIHETTEILLDIKQPLLWTANAPHLYKLAVELVNPDGQVIDDYIVTTGIRTVSQPGGVFSINGKPELLRAPLLFGARPPMENIALWEKCPPAEYYVQEMLMAKGMNGNGLRMSVHDRRMGGLNDPRICELADQMGIMLIWQTNTWLRITSATNIDYDQLRADIKQVRNNPSIVIWQPTNHPSWKSFEVTCRVYQTMHDEIMAVDPSRLIAPSADSRRMRGRYDDGTKDHFGNPCSDPNPAWTLPGMVRGNMDYMLGYGAEWHTLREWPYVKQEHLPNWMESTAYIPSYIESKERAYFNFEHDEIIGQPNWTIHRGKPSYHVYSYEREYDVGSIGRELTFDEWKTSQAWQALGGYETIVKCRWLDYDGLSWCNLRGGQNTCTYMKALIDYYGQPKLCYYAHQMAFQDILALSGNVDMVYGPKDTVPVIVMNLGEEKTIDLTVQTRDENDEIVHTQTFEKINLPAGRTVTKVSDLSLPTLKDGLYSFAYLVYEGSETEIAPGSV